MTNSDEQLALLMQKGNSEPLGILIDRYENKLKRYVVRFVARPEDAQDIVQDVFIKVYQNIQSFDAGRSFSAWVYRIAHNECVNFIKKKRPLTFDIDLDIFLPHKFVGPDVFDEYRAQENKEMINSVLDLLDYKNKEILTLYFFEELSYKDISDILKIPISSVGVKLLRAKNKVEELLRKKGLQNHVN